MFILCSYSSQSTKQFIEKKYKTVSNIQQTQSGGHKKSASDSKIDVSGVKGTHFHSSIATPWFMVLPATRTDEKVVDPMLVRPMDQRVFFSNVHFDPPLGVKMLQICVFVLLGNLQGFLWANFPCRPLGLPQQWKKKCHFCLIGLSQNVVP